MAPSTVVSRAFIQEGAGRVKSVTGTLRGSVTAQISPMKVLRLKTSCWSDLIGPLESCIHQAGGRVVKVQGPSDLFLSPIGERFVPRGAGTNSPDFRVTQAQAWARPRALG